MVNFFKNELFKEKQFIVHCTENQWMAVTFAAAFLIKVRPTLFTVSFDLNDLVLTDPRS